MREAFFAAPTSCMKAKGRTTGKVASTTSTKIARAASRSPPLRLARAGSEGSATMRPRMASISGCDTRPAATRDSALSITDRPVCGSAASRTERISVSERPRSTTVRIRYMTPSTKPQARLQPSAAMNMSRSSSRPDSATDTRAGEAEGHEQAEEQLHDPIDRMQDRLADLRGRGHGFGDRRHEKSPGQRLRRPCARPCLERGGWPWGLPFWPGARAGRS